MLHKPAASYGHCGEYMETEIWSKVVENYSKADLTYQKDKLIALSGMAREIQHLLKSTYAAGLWECHYHTPSCGLSNPAGIVQ